MAVEGEEQVSMCWAGASEAGASEAGASEAGASEAGANEAGASEEVRARVWGGSEPRHARAGRRAHTEAALLTRAGGVATHGHSAH